MAIETTFSIVKPNAVKKNVIGAIIDKFEKNGLKVAAAKFMRLTKPQCEEFYAEHKARPFFNEVVRFMTSGPVLLLALTGENAVTRNREIMGATDPKKSAPGTIRALWGDNVGENAVHGSDSAASAERELNLFFKPDEFINR